MSTNYMSRLVHGNEDGWKHLDYERIIQFPLQMPHNITTHCNKHFIYSRLWQQVHLIWTQALPWNRTALRLLWLDPKWKRRRTYLWGTYAAVRKIEKYVVVHVIAIITIRNRRPRSNFGFKFLKRTTKKNWTLKRNDLRKNLKKSTVHIQNDRC